MRWVSDWLSDTRFEYYLKSCNNNEIDALEKYELWSNINVALFKDILHLEICIRNCFDRALKERFGDDWVLSSGFMISTLSQSSINKIASAKSKHKNHLTNNSVISELSFGFWVSLTSNLHEQSIWIPTLRHVFSKGTKSISRKQVFKTLDEIRLIRNRIAHNEPIHNYNPKEMHDKVIWLTGIINPELSHFMEDMSMFNQIYDKFNRNVNNL